MLPRRTLRPLNRSMRQLSAAYKDVRWRPWRYTRNCSCSAPRPPPPTLNPTTKNPPTPPADHRTLGTEQELFTNSPYSPGSPLFLPNGAHIFNQLLSFLRAQYKLFGFEEVITPTLYKRSLWKKSGHLENYKNDMFEVRGQTSVGNEEGDQDHEKEYGLKPMNCPGHCLLFRAQKRSYKDLPIRYADFSSLHRNEVSGALSGLTRVVRFHQDDGHIFCRPIQITDEISKTLQFVAMVYKTFRLGPYKLVLSTMPKQQYIGTIEEWDRAEDQLKSALNNSGQEWTLNQGDGAFYGPKIDIILKDSDGKEHQTATIQLDFQLPQRFNLQYQARAPEHEAKGITTTDPEQLHSFGSVTPVIIHRAIFGSLERFMALLIEHHKGRWPFWLSPRQAIILTLDSSEGLTKEVQTQAATLSGAVLQRTSESDSSVRPRALDEPDFRVDVDTSHRTLGKKIREAKTKKYNLILVRGPRNLEMGTIDLDITGQPDPEATRKILEEIMENKLTDERKITLDSEKMVDLMRRLSRAYL